MTNRNLTQSGHVIAKLGGINATARLLGHKSASTVQGWADRGFIPGPRQKEILEKARDANLPLTDDDFIVHLRDDNGGGGGEPANSDADRQAAVVEAPQITPEVAA